ARPTAALTPSPRTTSPRVLPPEGGSHETRQSAAAVRKTPIGMNSSTFDTRSLIDHVAGPRSQGSQNDSMASAADTTWNSNGNRLPQTANATNAAAAPVNATSRAA